jgi:hypothetical protein
MTQGLLLGIRDRQTLARKSPTDPTPFSADCEQTNLRYDIELVHCCILSAYHCTWALKDTQISVELNESTDEPHALEYGEGNGFLFL